MRKLLLNLRHYKVAVTLAFILVLLLLWGVGTLAGSSRESLLLWTVLVMVGWVAVLLVGKLLSDRASNLLEGFLRHQTDEAVLSASPEQRAEITLLRSRLLSAIETLKKSHLGKLRGKAALYELPWYMIIGHPAAGKSTAVVNSGLTFPFADKGNAGIQGVGGTRNCDWFFASEGVLLDTAGRYSVEREDRPEWLEFLRMLRKYRPKTPVNGILVAVSLPEILQASREGFAAYARQVRERIQEIDQAFGARVPVYLVFTKLDRIGGFSEFFQDADDKLRQQVWGATLTHEQAPTFNPTGLVEHEFEQLCQGLVQHGTDRLALSRDNLRRPGLFTFPHEFAALKPAISRFVDYLFEDTPYHSKPLLRGFYFTSALQESIQPALASGNRVARRFALNPAGEETRLAAESRSFFLRDLFRDVIFPDQYLITRQQHRASPRHKLAGIAAGVLAFALIAGMLSWSYLGNRSMVQTAQADLALSQQLAAQTTLDAKLEGLLRLQTHLEQLYAHRTQGAPWSIRMGLYQGAALEQQLRAVYFRQLESTLLQPVQGQLEQALSSAVPATANNPLHQVAFQTGKPAQPQEARLEDAYNTLKTYLMLNDRQRMDAAHLADQLPRFWRPWLTARNQGPLSPAQSAMAERIVAFYVSQIHEADLPVIDNAMNIVSTTRASLKGVVKKLSSYEQLYNSLKTRGNTQFPQMSVATILQNRDGDLVAGSYAIPGSFTREAWDKYFRKAIDDASRGEVKGEDWVLASEVSATEGADSEKIRQGLTALYQAEYIREWQRFLQGIAIRDFSTIADAGKALGRLSDPQASPIKLVLQRAEYETSWDNDSKLKRTLATTKNSVVEKAGNLLFDEKKPAPQDDSAYRGEVGNAFLGVNLALNAGGAAGQAAGIAGYLERLGKLRAKFAGIEAADPQGPAARGLVQATLAGQQSEFAETLSYIDTVMLASVREETKAVIRPLLVRPLMQGFAALLPPTEADINEAWKNQVVPAWGSLAYKYPFSDSNNDATLQDIARFAKPGDGSLFQFNEKVLGGLISKRGDSYTPRTWGNLGIRFNPGYLQALNRLNAASPLLMKEGEAELRFEVQPQPTAGLSEIVLEIDGQSLRYRNGPQPWNGFGWPGSGSTQGARIVVTGFNGTSATIASFPGRLGWMRLLSAARQSPADHGGTLLSWPYKLGNGESGTVSFALRPVSGGNALAFANLRRMQLPETITQ